MSYQYPPPPPNGPEMDLPHAGYVPTYGLPPQSSSMGMVDPHGSPMPIRDRKDPEMFLKRSFSTPDARAQQQQQQQQQHAPESLQQQQSQMVIAGEKRRNKLGYHRTSVACGHCRRRKIRCIPCTTDMQGRCINCIRLKKECSFYPVDQPPPADPRAKASSRSSAGQKPASASSSPATSTGNPVEPPSQQSFPPVTMTPVPSMAPPTITSTGVEVFPPETKVPSSSTTTRPYEFTSQPATNWISTESCPSPTSKPGDLGASWRPFPPESPMAAQFPPFTQAPPSSATWTSGSSESSSRDDMAWGNYPPPVRSMSYGGEPLVGPQHANYPPMTQGRSFERRSSNMPDVYPSSMGVAVPSLEAPVGSAMDPSGSLSAGAVPPPGYGAWPQQPPTPQQQHQYVYQKPGEGYPNWGYGEAGGIQSVTSNQPGQHLSDGENHGVYYPSR